MSTAKNIFENSSGWDKQNKETGYWVSRESRIFLHDFAGKLGVEQQLLESALWLANRTITITNTLKTMQFNPGNSNCQGKLKLLRVIGDFEL